MDWFGVALCEAAMSDAMRDPVCDAMSDAAEEGMHITFRPILPPPPAFAPEHRPDLKHPLKVRGDGHLLVQLRRLRKAGGYAHVVQHEDRRAALTGPRNQLGCVDLLEALA